MIFTYYFNYIMFDDNKCEELNKYLYTLITPSCSSISTKN